MCSFAIAPQLWAPITSRSVWLFHLQRHAREHHSASRPSP